MDKGHETFSVGGDCGTLGLGGAVAPAVLLVDTNHTARIGRDGFTETNGSSSVVG